MTSKSRFRYTLEPVLLRRQWDLDALKLELNEINGQLAKLVQQRDTLLREAELVGAEWKRQSDASSHIIVERFTTVTYYLDDLARQLKIKQTKIGEVELARDTLIDRIALAQRGLDAIEQHRDEMHGLFLKQRTNIEYKIADDHWSTLHTNTENYDH